MGVQGISKSLMLIALRSSSPVLVMISSTSMPICNHFHARQPNIDKITSFFTRCPSFYPSFEGNPFAHRPEILSWNTRDSSYVIWWKPEVSILFGLGSVAGRDRHQDRQIELRQLKLAIDSFRMYKTFRKWCLSHVNVCLRLADYALLASRFTSVCPLHTRLTRWTDGRIHVNTRLVDVFAYCTPCLKNQWKLLLS